MIDAGNWFRETNERFWPGQEFGLRCEKVLYHQNSDYQDILVFKSQSYGNVLFIDNCIQCTERDEFAYHEMATFLPLMTHPNPKNILIVGGGNGGALREVIKHPKVERVVICEIDEKYLPSIAKGYNSPKVKVHISSGVEFMKMFEDEFDVIITASSDPEGPAEELFEQSYYKLMKVALKKPHGIICCQGECIWLDLPLIKKVIGFNRELFPTVAYAYLSIPTYTCGTIGFFLCSVDPENSLTVPINDTLANHLDTHYYSADVHRAAFILPKFVRKALDED